MKAKAIESETLQSLLTDALALLSDEEKRQWSHEIDRNRVRFSGPGPEFMVRDKDGYFTITYEYEPDKRTTRHYDHATAVQFLLKLFRRPAVNRQQRKFST